MLAFCYLAPLSIASIIYAPNGVQSTAFVLKNPKINHSKQIPQTDQPNFIGSTLTWIFNTETNIYYIDFVILLTQVAKLSSPASPLYNPNRELPLHKYTLHCIQNDLQQNSVQSKNSLQSKITENQRPPRSWTTSFILIHWQISEFDIEQCWQDADMRFEAKAVKLFQSGNPNIKQSQ